MLQLGAIDRPPRCPAGPPEAVADWRVQTMHVLEELLGEWPDACPPALEVVSEVDAGPYLRVSWPSTVTVRAPACLDVMAASHEIDPDRLGACGFSYGATCTLFLSALDERVRSTVVSGYFSSVAESHKVPANLCASQVLPGMLGRIEHGDLAALIMPRPLHVESGEADVLFPLPVALSDFFRRTLV